jgi:hypothetical protein
VKRRNKKNKNENRTWGGRDTDKTRFRWIRTGSGFDSPLQYPICSWRRKGPPEPRTTAPLDLDLRITPVRGTALPQWGEQGKASHREVAIHSSNLFFFLLIVFFFSIQSIQTTTGNALVSASGTVPPGWGFPSSPLIYHKVKSPGRVGRKTIIGA